MMYGVVPSLTKLFFFLVCVLIINSPFFMQKKKACVTLTLSLIVQKSTGIRLKRQPTIHPFECPKDVKHTLDKLCEM